MLLELARVNGCVTEAGVSRYHASSGIFIWFHKQQLVHEQEQWSVVSHFPGSTKGKRGTIAD
jgi:hypothetical protein